MCFPFNSLVVTCSLLNLKEVGDMKFSLFDSLNLFSMHADNAFIIMNDNNVVLQSQATKMCHTYCH